MEYKVTTKTGTEGDADTDEDFYYTIIGTRGTTSEYLTNTPGDDRVLGQTDTYTITDNTDIGEFRCVSIRIGGSDADGWLIKQVRVTFTAILNF